MGVAGAASGSMNPKNTVTQVKRLVDVSSRILKSSAT